MSEKRLQNTEVAYGGVKMKAMQMYFLVLTRKENDTY
jgi:hypothetical protein|tara:strand:+ start:4604 stop:4714 length:111 start_codon:yes stop_codon:yes gene_type:complete